MRLANRLRHLPIEFPFLMAALTVTGGVWAFVELADEVIEGEARVFDRMVLMLFRSSADPQMLLGPPWFQEFCRDVTALGSIGVLVMTVLAVAVFLLLARRVRMALFVAVSSLGGVALGYGLKTAFDRPRPDLVPHAVEVMTASFPSGHAMMSAVVYLTLGALLARLLPERRLRIYVLGIALLLSTMIGLTRIYFGVHWPSDVIAGWAVGAAWAAGCWLVSRLLVHPRQVRVEGYASGGTQRGGAK